MTDLTAAIWRKSSRSNAAGNCVEVATNLVGAHWRKSSRSNGAGGACVEVSDNLPNLVGVRDSKDSNGPALVINPIAWSAFTNDVKADNCDF